VVDLSGSRGVKVRIRQVSPSVSIILVPDHIAALRNALDGIKSAMATHGLPWEAVVPSAGMDMAVDTSSDAWSRLRFAFPQLRFSDDQARCGSPILDALHSARSALCVVMRCSQTQPGSTVVTLVNALLDSGADMAVTCRSAPGGSLPQRNRMRLLGILASPLAARAAATDEPFAVQQKLLEGHDKLQAFGPHLALDLIVQLRPGRVVRVPAPAHGFQAAPSHATFEQLSRLYDYKYPKGAPRVKFVICAAAGATACLAVCGILHQYMLYNFPFAMAVGLFAMIAVTLLFFARYVRTRAGLLATDRPYGEFIEMSLAEFFAGWTFACLTNSNLAVVRASVGIAVLLLVRYAARKVFRHDQRGVRAEPRPVASFHVAFPGDTSASSAASA
jgi:hypothetical protein